jgi:hypothetical protein
LSAALAAAPALSNGGLFFEDEEHHHAEGTVYFGAVKDPAGNALPGVSVSLRIKGESVDFVSQTNALGRYRSTQVRRDVDPKSVEVSVAKAGFREAGKVLRTRNPKPGLPIEINFTMKPEEQAAK